MSRFSYNEAFVYWNSPAGRLQGIELQEKDGKFEKHVWKLIRKNPNITDVY